MDTQKFIPPSYDVLIDIIHNLTKPGEPGLGGFGWVQPFEDTTVKWGDIYATINQELTIEDILTADIYKRGRGYVRELICDLDTAKNIMRQYPRCSKNGKEIKYHLDAILTAEVFDKWDMIDKDDKPFYRLCAAVVNAYLGETHNFAIEFMDYLASHCTCEPEYAIYESENRDTEDLLQMILDNEDLRSNIAISIEEREFPSFREQDYNQEIYDYLQETYNQYSADFQKFVKYVTGVNVDSYFYYEGVLFQFVAILIEELKIIITAGDFTLQLTDDIEGAALRQWLETCAASQILPGFESL